MLTILRAVCNAINRLVSLTYYTIADVSSSTTPSCSLDDDSSTTSSDCSVPPIPSISSTIVSTGL